MNVRILDNRGETVDRYTVILLDTLNNGFYDCLGLSDNPTEPLGFSQFSTCSEDWANDAVEGGLDFEMSLSDLTPELQQHIKSRIAD